MSSMFGIAFEFDSAELTEQARRDLQTWPMRSTGLELAGTRVLDAKGSPVHASTEQMETGP